MWRINSVEEITTTTTEEYSDDDEYNDLPVLSSVTATSKVPFPEAGIDLIDTGVHYFDYNEEVLRDNQIRCIHLQNWEENWLFRKKKKTDSKSDIMLGYMAMILSELPVCMLIPNPNHKLRVSVGERDVDQLSELSEHNSFGSLDFSDDESEDEDKTQNHLNGEEVINKINNNIFPMSERVATNRSPVMKRTTEASNESNEPKVKGSVVVGSDYKNKPNVKSLGIVAKVPNFMPKELRNNDKSSKTDPYLVLSPGDASVQSGILVQFCCRAKGTKPLSFSWFRNDIILKSDQNYRIFQSGEENVLEIRRTSGEDSAQYSCVVYNRFGYHWCDFNLEVRPQDFNVNKMPINKRNLKSNITSKPKGVFNTNPKHETHKTRPLVVQRTWAERVAELKNLKSRPQFNQIEAIEEKNEENDKENNMTDGSDPTVPLTAHIAEREHKKWETSDIEWKDNPYSTENLSSRIQRRSLMLSEESLADLTEDIKKEDEDQVDTSFLSSKSKDFSRYKKDYYIRNNKNKEEALRSLDENEYSNSKYFDLSHAKQKSMNDLSKVAISSNQMESNHSRTDPIVSDSELTMPSVKDLVNRFAKSEDPKTDSVPKLVDVKRKSSFSDPKLNNSFTTNNNCKNTSNSSFSWQNNHSNFKVHSLTARSLTKEFREMSQLNLPRTQRNRMDIYSQNQTNCLIESEPSSPSTACSPTNEGYASDESNGSSEMSNGAPPVPPPVLSSKTNGETKFSRSILRRASYWEKRCEQGLISDSAVNEDFPPMEKTTEEIKV